MVKDNSYVVIQSFMVNELNLKGNELLVYAVIYGYSQDGKQWFRGTRKHLSEWCGATKATVSNCLKSLVEKGLIERKEINEDEYTKILYRAVKNLDTPYKNFEPPLQKISTIDNKEDNTILDSKKINKKSRTIDLSKTDEKYSFSGACIAAFNVELKKDYKILPRYIADYLESVSIDYEIDDVRKMIRFKADYFNEIKKPRNINPSTFFRESNFPRYMDEALNSKTNDFSWLDEYDD